MVNNDTQKYLSYFYNQITLLQINKNTKNNIINFLNNKLNNNIDINISEIDLENYIKQLYYNYYLINDMINYYIVHYLNIDYKSSSKKFDEIIDNSNLIDKCYQYIIDEYGKMIKNKLDNEELYLLGKLLNENKIDIHLIIKNKKYLDNVYGKLLFHIDNKNVLNILNELYNKKYDKNEMIDYIIKISNKSLMTIEEINNLRNKDEIHRTYHKMYNNDLIYLSPRYMKYYYDKLNTYNCHIGQLKLFYSLFEYLTYIQMNSIKHNENYLNNSLIVYIGSAPGNNIYTNMLYFKNTTWLLYDPNNFDKRLIGDLDKNNHYFINKSKDNDILINDKYGGYTYIKEINNNQIFIKTTINDSKKNGYFGLDRINEILLYQKILNKKYIIFISDIRLSINEYNIIKDNELCMRAILQLKPISYQLKFRVPYYGDKYEYSYILNKNLTKDEKNNLINNELLNDNDDEIYLYLDGKIYYQIYSQIHSAEMRLTNFNKDLKYKLHRYNKKEIESNLFYFNISRNFFIYENLNNIKYKKIIYYALKNKFIKIFKPTYENISELIIVYKYLKYNNINHFNNIKKLKEKYNIIKQLIIEIYHNIGSYDNKQNDKNFIMNRRFNCINNTHHKISNLY